MRTGIRTGIQTGSDVHGSLVARIGEVRRRLDREEARVEKLQGRLAEAGRRRCGAIRSLAELHLPGMTEEAVANTLAEMEAEVRGIFDRKQDRLAEVERALPKQRAAVAEAEAALAKVTGELEETGRERARLAREVYAELQATPQWERLSDDARRLRAKAAASEKRLEAARREQSEKVPAYDRDPLFSYLRRRRHGTAQARGNAVTRRLDGWVAGVANYADLRSRYDFLNALPEFAAEALAEDRESLAAALPRLSRLEEAVIVRRGLAPVLERGERLYGERRTARRALRDAEAELRSLTGELAALHDERGSYYDAAIDGLEAHLKGKTVDELAAMARATGDPRDDAIVAELPEIDREIAELRAELDERRRERSRLADRLAGLEEIRDRFEADDWNGGRSRFAAGVDVDALLLGFIAGNLTSGHVQRTLARSHSFAPPSPFEDGFGPGGFSSGGGFGGGGFGGGGFSSGGGFGGGGGGFSSGGGF